MRYIPLQKKLLTTHDLSCVTVWDLPQIQGLQEDPAGQAASRVRSIKQQQAGVTERSINPLPAPTDTGRPRHLGGDRHGGLSKSSVRTPILLSPQPQLTDRKPS